MKREKVSERESVKSVEREGGVREKEQSVRESGERNGEKENYKNQRYLIAESRMFTLCFKCQKDVPQFFDENCHFVRQTPTWLLP